MKKFSKKKEPRSSSLPHIVTRVNGAVCVSISIYLYIDICNIIGLFMIKVRGSTFPEYFIKIRRINQRKTINVCLINND